MSEYRYIHLTGSAYEWARWWATPSGQLWGMATGAPVDLVKLYGELLGHRREAVRRREADPGEPPDLGDEIVWLWETICKIERSPEEIWEHPQSIFKCPVCGRYAAHTGTMWYHAGASPMSWCLPRGAEEGLLKNDLGLPLPVPMDWQG